MKRITAIFLALVLTLGLLPAALAANDSTFDAGLTIGADDDGNMTVTVKDSEILASQRPALSIICTYDEAYVTYDGEVIKSSLSDGFITFTVAAGGTYTIIEGTAPDPEPEPEPEPEPDPDPDPEPKPEWENPFDDVKEDLWYYEGVAKVCAAGLMSGTDKDFEPELKLTRGMLMTMLARLNGQDTSGDGVWYRKGMDWAVEQGISDGTAPEANITREQIAVMLYRCAGEPDCNSDAWQCFPDADTVSDWARAAMSWAVANGIIQGADGVIAPNGEATRAETAVMLARFMELFGL